jgi:SAM-dependent methyltransferase
MKDLFSNHASIYAAFRPLYPQDLYDFIFKYVKEKNAAWDCGTGNGQVAQVLSKEFKQVYATDISQQQLDAAYHAANIRYSASAAETTSFDDNQFDLITVGQALHWFDHNTFFNEVKRVSKPGGVVAAWGYSILSISPALDVHLLDYYRNIVGPFWDAARKLVDEEYKTINFPFEEIKSPTFHITVTWTLDHLMGYLESWSATQKFMKVKGENPLPVLHEKLTPYWVEGETKVVKFPVFLRMATVDK